jgi:hypothetical protein
MPLQRRITDFGADNALGKISNKLEEYYGISVPVSSFQAITERHARAIKESRNLNTQISSENLVDHLVVERDGSD